MKKKKFLLILFLGLSLSFFGGCKIGDNFFNDGNDTPTVSEKDQKYDVYLMAVEEGLTSLTYEDWLDTIKGEIGPEGPAGKKLLLNISSTHIQYKYEGDLTWTNLISLDKLKGEDGTDGREVEFRKTDTSIEWRYKATDSWEHLIYLSEITGEKGDDGTTWYIDAGKPTRFDASESSYKRNDLYLDTNTGIVYRCVIYTNGQGDWWKEIELAKKEKITVNFDANLPAYMYEFDNYIENNKNLKETTIDKGSWLQLETFKNTKLKEYFLGWYIGEGVDETKITSYTSINEDCTLTAKWDYEKIDETYTSPGVDMYSWSGPARAEAHLSSSCGDVVHIAKTYKGLPIKTVYSIPLATNTSEILLPGSANVSFHKSDKKNTSLLKVSWYGEITATRIEFGAFYNCTALTDIDIPETITEIEDYAFYNCTSLEGLKLTNVETIGDYAFYNCSALNNSIWTDLGFWLPESLKSIGDNAFEGCTFLNSIYINSDEIANLEDNNSYLFSYADTINIKRSITTESTAYLDETQGHFTGDRKTDNFNSHYEITKVKEN